MLSNLRPICVVASVLTAMLSAGCSLFSHTSGKPPDTGLPPPIHSNPLMHEALASSPSIHSRHSLDVLYPPPSPLPEQPTDAKPDGDDVVWAPGYWIWDTRVDNWHWIHGVWVHAPRGRHWTPGYWSIVADGWRWVPGCWAINAPPPPPAPPVLASPSNGYWSDNPGLGFYTGYGLWWGTYPYSYFYPVYHNRPTPSVVASPSPHNAATTPPRLDMASIYASVPKPLASTFDPAERFELHTAHPLLALHPGAHEYGGHVSSLFSTALHEAGFHDPLGFHSDFAARSVSGSEIAHEGSSHSSGGHGGGGGHGR